MMHTSRDAITRPIFIVGCARSGTTILYNLLAGHPDLGWFSNYNERLEQFPILSLISRVYKYPSLRKRFGHARAFPRPSEGYSKWASLQPEVNSAAAYETVLSEAHAAGADVGTLNAYVAKVLRYTGTRRFLNKNTRNALRIPCLRAVFPDAYFIHVLRDGRAVANSLLKMSWWPEVRLWSAGERRAPDLERNGIDPVLDPRPALDENDLEGT